MSTYPNGRIPERLLIRRGDFLLTAGTWAKFDDFSARIKRRTGVLLTIPNGSFPGGRGEGAYRTHDMQVRVKNYWISRGQGRMAAAPGYSSHGGEFNGQDALAVDIDNYARVPLAIFFEEGRAAGFQMGYFDGKSGRPYEPWHIIDRDPYRRVATASAGGSTAVTFPEEEDDMKLYRWNGQHVFGIGRGEVYHVPDTGTLARLQKTHGEFKELDNDGLTAELNFAGVHWDAVDAVLTGRAPLAGGKLWSRLAAEGIAIRGNQAEQSKTLADVLSTAERISKNG